MRSTVDDRAAARAERAPHSFEERRVQRDVAGPIGDRRVQQRDVGLQRRQQADLAERGVDARVAGVRLHRRSADGARDDRGQSARAGFQTLREREERPVLDVDLTALVGAREHRIGREVRERVTRVPGDHLAHEAAPEEQRAEARQREHDQRELRVAAPPLADDLTRRRRPARVADHRVQHVAGVHVARQPRRRACIRLSSTRET